MLKNSLNIHYYSSKKCKIYVEQKLTYNICAMKMASKFSTNLLNVMEFQKVAVYHL